MFTAISLPLLICSLAMVFDETQSSSGVSMQTAITVILAVIVVYCAKKIMEMHERIAALESRKPSEKSEGTDSETVSGPISQEVVAAISAAVVTTFGRHARIIKMRQSPQESHAWSVEGRRHIFHSHSVR
ncbi:MAG: hypothetical protein WC378_03470 [Opitutaceae bacterium]|jgi:cell division protein ZapA (FtsZ GTPase activity inhibitor)